MIYVFHINCTFVWYFLNIDSRFTVRSLTLLLIIATNLNWWFLRSLNLLEITKTHKVEYVLLKKHVFNHYSNNVNKTCWLIFYLRRFVYIGIFDLTQHYLHYGKGMFIFCDKSKFLLISSTLRMYQMKVLMKYCKTVHDLFFMFLRRWN